MHSGRLLWTIVAAAASLTVMAPPSQGQTREGQELLPAMPIPLAELALVPPQSLAGDPTERAERAAALQNWVGEFTAWKKWDETWRGRPEPGWVGSRARRQKPDPPAWLADECVDVVDGDALAESCLLLAEWQDDYVTEQVRARIRASRIERQESTKWWNSVHLDALWLTPTAAASYGVIGIHATLKVAGRWQVFVAPGAILLNVPVSGGSRAWTPATDLGFSYRLTEVRLTGTRRGVLHVNIAKAWILGDSTATISRTVDLVGLSLTMK